MTVVFSGCSSGIACCKQPKEPINVSEILSFLHHYFDWFRMKNLHMGLLVLTWGLQIICLEIKFCCSRSIDIPVWFNRVLFLYGDRIGRQIGFKETYYLLSLSEYKGQTSVLSQRKQLSSSAFVFPFSERSTLSFQSLPVCESVAPLWRA